jgi:hypothetical protein
MIVESVNFIDFKKRSSNLRLETNKKHVKIYTDLGIQTVMDPLDQAECFYSDDKKLFLTIPGSFYHCIHDFMGIIFHLYELDNDTLFILNTYHLEELSNAHSRHFLSFCISMLDDNNIRYELRNFGLEFEVNANNFYSFDYPSMSYDSSKSFLKYAMPYIKDKNIVPNKKVYVTRSRTNLEKNKNYSGKEALSISNTSEYRVDDEALLEEYFTGLGFEVIAPESFDSFQDQLNYFYSVKVLVGLSGGGLANSMLMQDEGVVIELMTMHTQIQFNDNKTSGSIWESLHYFYNSIAFQKSHTYLCLNNKDHSAVKLIGQLNSIRSLF